MRVDLEDDVIVKFNDSLLSILQEYTMYPDSGYKRAHAQSVCTRPFSRIERGLGTRLGEIRNEKLEMRKWKRKWKWSSPNA